LKEFPQFPQALRQSAAGGFRRYRHVRAPYSDTEV